METQMGVGGEIHQSLQLAPNFIVLLWKRNLVYKLFHASIAKKTKTTTTTLDALSSYTLSRG